MKEVTSRGAPLLVRTARPTTGAFVVGDADQVPPNQRTVDMHGFDGLVLLVSCDMDAGSTLTEVRVRLSFSDDGATYYDETAIDVQPAAGGVIDGDLVDVQYVVDVVPGTTINRRIALQSAHDYVRVAVGDDGVGVPHANDLVGVTANRLPFVRS